MSLLALVLGKSLIPSMRGNKIIPRYALLVCLSFIWTSYTNAPPLEPADIEQSSNITVKSAISAGRGTVILKTPKAYYQSYGSREWGASGEIIWKNQPSLFSRQRSYFISSAARQQKASPISYARFFKSWFTNQSKNLGGRQMRWLNAIILGDLDQLPYDIRNAVQRSGLHHLLVVSGLHLTMISFLFSASIGLIPTLGYALRLIPASIWLEVQSLLRMGSASAVLAYFIIVECPPNAERALISTVTFCISKIFLGSLPLLKQLQIMLVIQSLAFPIGFVGEANVLGWGAYLLLSHARLKYGSQNTQFWLPLIATQLHLCILGSAVFGELNLLPIIFMPALMPVLTLLMSFTTLSLALPEWLEPRVALSHLHMSMQWLLFMLQASVEHLPWLSNSSENLPKWFQPLALTAAAILLLNAVKNIKIRQHLSL